MVNITLKNIPDEIYERLKRQAAAHRRSVNGEVIHCLDMALKPQRISVDERLERIRRIRPNIDAEAVTLDELLKAVEEGRP
jgi:plasmid stability protein